MSHSQPLTWEQRKPRATNPGASYLHPLSVPSPQPHPGIQQLLYGAPTREQTPGPLEIHKSAKIHPKRTLISGHPHCPLRSCLGCSPLVRKGTPRLTRGMHDYLRISQPGSFQAPRHAPRPRVLVCTPGTDNSESASLVAPNVHCIQKPRLN